METYNDQIPNEDNQQPEQAAPISEPVNTEPQIPGKKESPFADSPYVVMQQPDPVEPQQTIPDAPEPTPKEKKPMGKVWKRVRCAVLALALAHDLGDMILIVLQIVHQLRTGLITLLRQVLRALLDDHIQSHRYCGVYRADGVVFNDMAAWIDISQQMV